MFDEITDKSGIFALNIYASIFSSDCRYNYYFIKTIEVQRTDFSIIIVKLIA